MPATVITLPLPYQLAPNTLADADQVMADLNYLATQVNANIATPGTVANSASSTLLGYLSQVLTAGTGITLTTLNPGAAEQLSISSNAAAVQLRTITAVAACI